MLSIELIKKGCEFAEGFSISNNLGRRTFYTPCGNFAFTTNRPLDESFWKGAGSLFLQRVIEGINKNSDDIIIQVDLDFIDVKRLSDGETVDCQNFRIDYNNIDQAKEQAIKYILEKL